MTLAFTEFTNNVTTDSSTYKVQGDGIFDDMMESITAHIKSQYDSGAINGVDYAKVYLGAMQSVIQTAAKIYLETQIQIDTSALLQAQKLLVDKQVIESISKNLLLEAQKTTEDKKDDLITAQTLGFKVDAKQKVLAKTLETWAIYYSVNKTGAAPTIVNEAKTSALYEDILNDLPA